MDDPSPEIAEASPGENGTIPMEVDATIEDASVLSMSTTEPESRVSKALQQVVPFKRASTEPVIPHQAREQSSTSCGNNDTSDSQNVSSFSSSYAAMEETFQPSVAMLRKHWEGVIDGKGMQFDSLKRFFGGENEASAAMSGVRDMMQDGSFYTPLALRHTHSTPLKKAPSILDEYAMRTGLPPPIPLDPFQRSCSTPSGFRTRSVNSAFGSVRSTSPANTEEDCSLAGVRYISMEGEPMVSFRCSAFDPVQYYARQLEDMAFQEDMERTTIEVTEATSYSAGGDDGEEIPPKNPVKRRPKRGAAVAERFLANVRVFRRRRRGGRNSSFRSAASIHSLSLTDAEDDDEDKNDATLPPQTTVTVTTESSNAITTMPAPEPAPLLQHGSSPPSLVNPMHTPIPDEEMPLEEATSPTYQRFDSDVEDESHYQKIEASLHADSPEPTSSPTQQQTVDDRVQGSSVRIQVSGKNTPPSASFGAKENTSPLPFNTPIPERGSRSLESALTQRSNDSMTDSPQTNRSSNTGSSMGHTTHATSNSSIQQSYLSTISETDREVMIANKEGKRRRGLDSLEMKAKPDFVTSAESVNSSSTNSNSTGTNPHGYLALQADPSPREGANVAMDRFFSNGSGNPSIVPQRVPSLGNSTTSHKSGQSNSPVTDGSSALTHTSSSSSSPSEPPPTFVSYLYKKNTSDLTSTREEMESCDSRFGSAENEEREGSPAPIVSYQPICFEGAALWSEQQVPKPLRPPSRPDKFRSRPPRSPVKGSRNMTTPPPSRTSPLYYQLSPPRYAGEQAVPHQNIHAQPYVLRSTDTGKSLVSMDQLDVQVQPDPDGEEAMHGITYEEHSIEIMKPGSKDDLLPTM